MSLNKVNVIQATISNVNPMSLNKVNVIQATISNYLLLLLQIYGVD